MIITGQGRLRRVWLVVYERLARILIGHLLRRDADATAYVRGSLGARAPEPGLSDIDLVVLARGVPGRLGEHRSRLDRRWRRLCRLAPPLEGLISIAITEEASLRETVHSTALTYGLGSGNGTPKAFYFGPAKPPDDVLGLSYRPGLYRAMGDWRLLSGRERRPHVPPRTAQDERIAGWMEVQQTWRYVFKAGMSDLDDRYRGYLLPKLTADLARIWLWLVHQQPAEHRIDALDRAARLAPDQAESLRRAGRLIRAPEPTSACSFGEMLPLAARLTARIADKLSADLDAAGWTDVKLRGADPTGLDRNLIPLADWRAVVVGQAGAAIRIAPGDPTEPKALAAALTQTGPYAALRMGDLLVLPSPWTRGILRAAQFPGTDPVTFALLEGSSRARFPDVAGWSTHDWARRAVSEHAAFLRTLEACGRTDGQALSMLLTATRAALFLDGVESGEPELAVSVAAAVAQLGERLPAGSAVAQEALGAYSGWVVDRRPPEPRTVTGLKDLLDSLPAYSRSEMPVAAR
jgi:hypothetical protein